MANGRLPPPNPQYAPNPMTQLAFDDGKELFTKKLKTLKLQLVFYAFKVMLNLGFKLIKLFFNNQVAFSYWN